MEDARYYVAYPASAGGTQFAWFITNKDASDFEHWVRRKEGFDEGWLEIGEIAR